MEEVKVGRKVTRLEWDDTKEYGFMMGGWLSIHTKGQDHTWMVNDGDITARDWVLVKEDN